KRRIKHRLSVGNIRRLLEKGNCFFCVRCTTWKLFLSCGRKGIGETPKCGSTGGSPAAAHGKRSVFLKRVIYTNHVCILFDKNISVPASVLNIENFILYKVSTNLLCAFKTDIRI